MHAQSSLQIYGIMDAGVLRSDTGEPGGGKKTELATGNSAGTRLGFRGTEDLGGGLKALFNLEMGISNDTGTLLTFGEPAGTVFGRRSFVGLQGGFGEVLVGRDYTPGVADHIPHRPVPVRAAGHDLHLERSRGEPREQRHFLQHARVRRLPRTARLHLRR